MNGRPAGKKKKQRSQASDQEADNCGNSIDLYQGLCRKVYLQSCSRTRSKLFSHFMTLLFLYYYFANHQVMFNTAKFITYNTIFASFGRCNLQDIIITGNCHEVGVELGRN